MVFILIVLAVSLVVFIVLASKTPTIEREGHWRGFIFIED